MPPSFGTLKRESSLLRVYGALRCFYVESRHAGECKHAEKLLSRKNYWTMSNNVRRIARREETPAPV